MKSRSRSVVSVGEKSQDGDCSTPDLDLPRLHAFTISTLDIQSRMIRDEESLSRTIGMSSSTLHLALPDLLHEFESPPPSPGIETIKLKISMGFKPLPYQGEDFSDTAKSTTLPNCRWPSPRKRLRMS